MIMKKKQQIEEKTKNFRRKMQKMSKPFKPWVFL